MMTDQNTTEQTEDATLPDAGKLSGDDTEKGVTSDHTPAAEDGVTSDHPTGGESAAADTPRRGNDEAAKWRVRFREAEATNATLTAKVAALQTAQVAGMATGPGKLHDGTDLLANIELEHLLDEDGDVDQEKVSDALDELFERKPHLRKPVFDGDIGQGERGQAGRSTSWHDIIAG